jgi:hypothetical protein
VAGCADLTVMSFRRFSGVRGAAVNLVDAGVAEDVVMKIGGWQTRAMFSRYNVLDTDRVRAAMEQGGQYVAERMRNASVPGTLLAHPHGSEASGPGRHRPARI